jgi:hypothetical protein
MLPYLWGGWCVPCRHVCILRPSEAEHKCKYYHVWTIDSLARCMLAISLRLLPRFTHSCLRKYSQVSAPDVGMSFAYAISVPTLGASRVGMSCAIARSVPTLEPVDNSAPVCNLWITWGAPCVDTGGGGLLVFTIVVATQVY